MGNVTAEKVLQNTFKHLEQMLDEKKRIDRKDRDRFRVNDSSSRDVADDNKRNNRADSEW